LRPPTAGNRKSQDRRFSSASSEDSIDLNRAADCPFVDANQGDRDNCSGFQNLSEEVRNTFEVGTIIGFQMEGCEAEIRSSISKSGEILVNQ